MRQHRLFAFLLAGIVATTATPALAGSAPPRPLTVDGIRAWQKTGKLAAADRAWPLERSLDLNGDGNPELLIAVGGSERGLAFALFSRDAQGWRLLADRLEATPPLVDVLAAEQDGWRDLVAFERRGSDGYRLRVYGWNGSGYAERAVDVVTATAGVAGVRVVAKSTTQSGAGAAATNTPTQDQAPVAESAPGRNADATAPPATRKRDGSSWWHHPNEPRRPTVMPRRR